MPVNEQTETLQAVRTADEQPAAVASVTLLTPVWGADGGVSTHVKASATALAQRGIEVHLLAAYVRGDERVPGVTVHERPELLNRHASLQARLGECRQTTVAHFHQLDDAQVVEFVRRSTPVLISAHGYPGCTSGVYYFAPGQECARAHGPGCIPNLIARGCAHTRYPRTLPLKYVNVGRGLAAFRRADLAISYSSAVDRHLAVNGLHRRAVVPLFPTLPASGSSEPARARRVVFAGRLEHTKGVETLIHAAREVEGEFVICGDGRQLDGMRRLALRAGVAERVRFAGWLAPSALAAELSEASVIAVPSVWPEPFGLAGIEGLAAGRPVVASATGGIPDWLEEGVGLAVPPGDAGALARALEELLSDPVRGREMGRAGQRLVAERFSSERHVEVLLEAYGAARATWLSRRASA